MSVTISDREFDLFRRFIFDAAGISLTASKKSLVVGRLARRLQECRVASYDEYFRLLKSGTAPDEVQTAIDLLTTNETYFFRESRHFELLRAHALATARTESPFRVWSAASSTGEEAYSIAMVLAECLGNTAWEVAGTDISTRVLRVAAKGQYPMERARHIPPEYLRRFCLKGIDGQQGTLLVASSLRMRVRFSHANLNTPLPHLGTFDAVFLRNVMIYFNDDTKRQVARRVLSLIRPGGHLYIGHSETLHGISDDAALVSPSVYQKK